MKYDSPAACRFFTPDDAVRWALAAYYGASRRLHPPLGESFIDGDGRWSSPATFALDVQYAFSESIVAAAIDAKIPCDHGSSGPSCSWNDSGWAHSHADYLAGQEMNDLPGLLNVPDTLESSEARHG